MKSFSRCLSVNNVYRSFFPGVYLSLTCVRLRRFLGVYAVLCTECLHHRYSYHVQLSLSSYQGAGDRFPREWVSFLVNLAVLAASSMYRDMSVYLCGVSKDTANWCMYVCDHGSITDLSSWCLLMCQGVVDVY